MTELLVDEYGFLFGGEEAFPVDVTDHDWERPYPNFDAFARFRWEAGALRAEPDVFRHPAIRDWVCAPAAWSVLTRIAPSDVRLIGQGDLGPTELNVVQVVTILDVVDVDASTVTDYGSYQVIEFPTFRAGSDSDTRSRVFRIPGSYTDIFLGDLLKSELDNAGITGLGYTPIHTANNSRSQEAAGQQIE